MRSSPSRHLVLVFISFAVLGAGIWLYQSNQTELVRLAPRKEVPKKTDSTPPVAPASAPVENVAATMTQPEALQNIGKGWTNPASEPEALRVFTAWIGTYLKASPQVKNTMLAEGLRLARERRTVLAKMIEQDPEAALAAAVPVMTRKELPAELQALLEERVSGQGELALIGVTPVPGETVAEPLVKKALVSDQEYRAYTYGRRARINSLESASIIGVALDGKLAVSDSPVRLLEPGETAEGRPVNEVCVISGISTPVDPSAPLNTTQPVAVDVGGKVEVLCSPAHVAEYANRLIESENARHESLAANGQQGTSTVVGKPAKAWTHGTKKLLIIRVDFSDKTGTPTNTTGGATIDDTFAVNLINSANGVRDFYEQGSYGETSVQISPVVSLDSPDVTAVLRMPKTASYYTTNDRALEMHADARTLAQATGLNLNSYDRIGVVFSRITGTAPVFNWSGLGGVESKNFWINGYYTFSTVAHEIGHNYGLQHSSLWQVSDGNAVSASGTTTEYGDVYDIMGSGTSSIHHFSQWNKSILQWIPDTSVPVAATSGTYRVYRFDHQGANTANTLALKVTRNRATDYWIGYRRATANASLNGGAYILWGYNDNEFGRLLDMTTPGTDTADVALAIGTTFTDAATGVTLKPLAQGGSGADEWLDMQVTLLPRISWSQAEYVVSEQGATAVLTVTRNNNSTGAVSVNYATSNGTATQPSDYTSTSGTLTWASGDTAPKTVTIPVVADASVEGTEKFNVTLSSATGGAVIVDGGATVTLVEQGSRDPTFAADFLNLSVNKVLALPDGGILTGGNYKLAQAADLSLNPRGGIALFDQNGALDRLFASDGGFDDPTTVVDDGNYDDYYIKDIAMQADGKFIVVGSFNYMHKVARGNIARLNTDGTLDPGFATGVGANGAIKAVLALPNGKIVIGGSFSSYNGTARSYLVQLNADGTLDTSFVGPTFGAATGWQVQSLALQADGKILVGGLFYLPGASFQSGICRVTSSGTLDSTFNGVVQGAHKAGSTGLLMPVKAILAQADGSIFIAGAFTAYNNVARSGLAKLTSTGALDTTFTTGLTFPADDFSDDGGNTLLLQPDNKIIVGGLFTAAGGTTANNLARMSTSGTVDTVFSQVAGPAGVVFDLSLQANGRVVFGAEPGGYQGSTAPVTRPLWRFFAGLTGLPGTLQITSEAIAAVEGASATISVSRTGGSSGALTLGYSTVPGTATTSDYTTTAGTISWTDGDSASKTITVPITADALAESAETFIVNIGRPSLGSVVLGTLQQTQVTVNTAFDSWRSTQFTPVELADSSLSGDLADIEHDGIVNLHEFAFNLSPKTADVAGLPTLGKTNVSGSDYLSITFTRRKPSLDLTYTPQTNSSLPGTWQSTAVQVGSAVDNGNGTETVTYRDTTPMGQAGSPTRFMRVQVTRAQ